MILTAPKMLLDWGFGIKTGYTSGVYLFLAKIIA
jgi:hypothetical protein